MDDGYHPADAAVLPASVDAVASRRANSPVFQLDLHVVNDRHG